MTQTKLLMAAFGMVLLLSACAEKKLSNAELYSLSCTELAREIGKFGQIKKNADEDSLTGTLEMFISEDEGDQIVAGAESVVGDLASRDADEELTRLQAAFSRRGCR